MEAKQTNDKLVLRNKALIDENIKKLNALIAGLGSDKDRTTIQSLYEKYRYVSPKPEAIKIEGKIEAVLDEIKVEINKAQKKRILFKKLSKTHHLAEVDKLIQNIRVLIEQR